MTDTVAPRIPAGMRDILPAEMLKRQYVLDVVREVFELYGFEPLQTSAIELSDTLLGKYGPDAERLIYKAWYGDTPGGEFALRYDLSVPLSRVAAMYPELPRPFKRYQIAPVWRADRPQKGRYREFYQCDVDIVGSASMMADAEIVAVITTTLSRLGFTDFAVSINNRKLLDGIGRYAGVPDSLQAGLYRSIDKLDKIGLDGVRRELLAVGVPDEPTVKVQRAARLALQGKVDPSSREAISSYLRVEEGLPADFADAIADSLVDMVQDALNREVSGSQIEAETRGMAFELAPITRRTFSAPGSVIPEEVVNRLLDLLQISGPTFDVLDDLQARMGSDPGAAEGIEELRDLFQYLAALDVPPEATQLSFAMVRGLEYYTGPIYETTITKPKAMPSITGGGRYDELIGLFAGVSYPATGTSLGIERIIDAMDELGMFPPDIRSATADVLVTLFSGETVTESLRLATQLRGEGINTSIYFSYEDRLGDQIGYASAKGIPFVIILGPDEITRGEATVREMGETRREGDQRTVPVDEVGDALRGW